MDTNKLLCGDCVVVMKTFPDESIDCIVTSPPYKRIDGFSELFIDEFMEQSNRILKHGRHLCLNLGFDLIPSKDVGFRTIFNPMNIAEYYAYKHNFKLYSTYVWIKKTHQKSFGSYPYPPNFLSNPNFEFIWVFKKLGKTNLPSNDIKEKSKLTKEEWLNYAIIPTWNIYPVEPNLGLRKEMKIAIKKAYPFPLEIPIRLIKMYSFIGDIILDPFVGSGTTCIAAKMLNRKWFGIEWNFEYCQIASARLENCEIVRHNTYVTMKAKQQEKPSGTCGYSGNCSYKNSEGNCTYTHDCKEKRKE